MPAVVIHDPDPNWPAAFARAATDLHTALGDHALGIDHVGSTSVPGLASKDVIDVQVTVADLDDPDLEQRMDRADYVRHSFLTDVTPSGSNLTPAEIRKMTYSEPRGERRVNIHIRLPGAANTRYVLLTRDYLRAHPQAIDAYATLKRNAATHFADDIDAYYSVKDPFVAMLLVAAEDWAARVGWLADRRAYWDEVYGSRRPDEVSWYQEDPSHSRRLIGEVASGKDAAVIDVGGGASRLVDSLLDDEFAHVTVLDVSGAALAHAQRRLADRQGGVTWVQADATAYQPERRVDIWHDRAVFHFLCDPADQKRYVANLTDSVRPGGHAIIATFAEDGPERCSGLPVQRYSSAAMAAAVSPAFRPLRFEREAHATPSGGVQHYLYGLFERIG